MHTHLPMQYTGDGVLFPATLVTVVITLLLMSVLYFPARRLRGEQFVTTRNILYTVCVVMLAGVLGLLPILGWLAARLRELLAIAIEAANINDVGKGAVSLVFILVMIWLVVAIHGRSKAGRPTTWLMVLLAIVSTGFFATPTGVKLVNWWIEYVGVNLGIALVKVWNVLSTPLS